MKYKGYDMELVEVRWRRYSTDTHSVSGRWGWEINDLIAKFNLPHVFVVIENQLMDIAPITIKSLFVRERGGYLPIKPFDVWEFKMVSVLDYPVMQEAIDAHEFGPDFVGWDTLLKCREMTRQNDFCGIFMTAWAVAHTSHYTEWGYDPGPDEFELIGIVNDDLSITEVDYSWGHKVGEMEWFMEKTITDDPTRNLGLEMYMVEQIGGWQ